MTDELGRGELLKLIEKILDYLAGDPVFDDKDWKGLEQIKALIQKPGVTEEWIEEKAKELYQGLADKVVDVGMIDAGDFEGFIRSLVEEIRGK